MVENSVGFLSCDRDDPAALQLLIQTCHASMAQVLMTIDLTNPELLRHYDELDARARSARENIVLIATRDSHSQNPQLAALFVLAYLSQWDEGGRSLWRELATTLKEQWPNCLSPSGTYASRVLRGVVEILTALTELEDQDTASTVKSTPLATRYWNLITEELLSMVALLAEAEKPAEARACAWAAISAAKSLDLNIRVRASQTALRLARDDKNTEVRSIAAGIHALNLIEVARDNPDRRRDAFEAAEEMLFQLPTTTDLGERLATDLNDRLVSEDYLQALKPLFWISLPAEQRSTLPLDTSALDAVCKVRYEGSWSQWIKHEQVLRAVATMVENSRLALEPSSTARAARTHWFDWSIEHPSFSHAMPHGVSWARAENSGELLLVLLHEVCHVFSLHGWLGVTFAVLRWAWMQSEIALWGFVELRVNDSRDTYRQFLRGGGLARLGQVGIGPLARAEQALDFGHKVRILESVWMPWLEGVAVFAELAASPADDGERNSPIATVLHNLWDRNLSTIARDLNCSLPDALRRIIDDAEAAYVAALEEVGKPRLRTYLTRDAQKYLPGYLVVRSLVATWRSRSTTPLTGTKAFYALLHATRFGIKGALPNLGVPLDQFERDAKVLHVSWVRSLAALTAEDLRLLTEELEPESVGPIAWRDGRPQPVGDGWEVAQEKELEELVRQARSSLSGKLANLDRVLGADAGCKLAMEVTARVFAENPLGDLTMACRAAEKQVHRLFILPFGRTCCPYWLIEEDRVLACMIRTTEHHHEHGSASYDLVSFRLSEESFAQLSTEVERARSRRLEVTRIVDLVPPAMVIDDDGRRQGFHYLVFRLGEWLYIQPRGTVFGWEATPPTLAEAIRDRLVPAPMIEVLKQVTGEPETGARRTFEWIVSQSSWTITVGGMQADLTPWAARVRTLAEALLQPNESLTSEVGVELLALVVGDPSLAKDLANKGLEALAEAGTGALREWVRLLFESGLKPLAVTGAPTLSQEIAGQLGAIFERMPGGWDVVRLGSNLEGGPA